MVARRTLAALAVVFVALLGAGCTETIAGSGSLAADATVPVGPTETGEPTSGPTSEPTASPTSESTGGGSGGSNEVCAALDKAQVEAAFGGSVTLDPELSGSCRIAASDGRSMILGVYDNLTLAQYKIGNYSNLSVGGHPGIKTKTIIYVSRSTSPTSPGMVAAYFAGLGDNGDPIAKNLLGQLLKKFSR
jgi:hypothetical protein